MTHHHMDRLPISFFHKDVSDERNSLEYSAPHDTLCAALFVTPGNYWNRRHGFEAATLSLSKG